jgi:hypothetical protein
LLRLRLKFHVIQLTNRARQREIADKLQLFPSNSHLSHLK